MWITCEINVPSFCDNQKKYLRINKTTLLKKLKCMS